jgi:hypothetical protein
MQSFLRVVFGGAVLLLVLPLSLSVGAQQGRGDLRGRVMDEMGDVIVGATIEVTNGEGISKTTITNGEGVYAFTGLVTGKYIVRASAQGFAVYENPDVEVTQARRGLFDITLRVTIGRQEVTVASDANHVVSPENNADAVVLSGADLESLPDDPDELVAALQALAGPSAGPGGGRLLIDGFSGGRIPPKGSIREVRINQNPFSAEYDRPGFGRIEIFTKPGTERYSGSAFFNFNDESLNSRNPFASNRAPFQSRLYGGNLSGPLVAGKSSFFFDFERRGISDNAVINAFILDPDLNPTQFSRAVLTPRSRTTLSPRLDFQLSPRHTFGVRYTYARVNDRNNGVGGFSLASRAFNSSSAEQTLQLKETAVLGPQAVNEARFQFIRRHASSAGDDSSPTVNVLDAFTGGGSAIGQSTRAEDQLEFQNYTLLTRSMHTLKAGVQLRGVIVDSVSRQNYGGTFTFAGGPAPLLDADNNVVLGPEGRPVVIELTSLEQYRRTLLLERQGFSPTRIRALGAGATQFILMGGNPEARVSHTEAGLFIQDDWQVRPNLTFSAGLRYEWQSNLDDRLDFAPRISLAWSPPTSGAKRPKLVIRTGFGIFYERFDEDTSLRAARFDGNGARQVIVSRPDYFPNAPPFQELTARETQTVIRLDENLRAPYTMQAAVSVERELPYKLTLSTTFTTSRVLHLLRSRNTNAPLPGTFNPLLPGGGDQVARPLGPIGNVYDIESSGVLNQNQLMVSVNNRLNPKVTIFASYVLNRVMSNADVPDSSPTGLSFPVNSYNLSGEYGRSSLSIRHRFFLGGSINTLWGLRLNPYVLAFSGRPFNITTGRDANGDTLFNERPALASDLSRPGVIITRLGAFDPAPATAQPLIPRNFGTGPPFFTANLRFSRTFAFGSSVGANNAAAAGSRTQGRHQSGGRETAGADGPASVRALLGGGTAEKRFKLTLGLSVTNIFNHTNPGLPVGNLLSPLFGVSTSSASSFGGFAGAANSAAGNRRIEAQINIRF